MSDYTQHHPYLSEATKRYLSSSHKKILIADTWRETAAHLPVYDPASGEIIAHIADASPEDVDAAVQAARHTFESSAWQKMLPAQREKLLLDIADAIEAHQQELAELVTLENGKLLADAKRSDVAAGARSFRYFAGWATKIEGSTIDVSVPTKGGTFAFTRREPVGVVAAVIPWNFPFNMIAWKVAPALACGCTVVLKPSEETSLTALRFAEIALEAGLPAGALNVVTGNGRVAGASLVAHPDIDKIAFTGSTPTGKAIGKAALEHMTRFSLELGGKSPALVLEDADMSKVAAGVAKGIFYNQGQVCVAGSRLYAPRHRFDEVLDSISAEAEKLHLGSGFEASSQLGPLVSQRQQEMVRGFIEAGIVQGAGLVTGGAEAVSEQGYFVKPTILRNDDNKALQVVEEEIFGPVLVAMPYDNMDDLISKANSTNYGLAATIWSESVSTVHSLIPRIKAGIIYVNSPVRSDPNLPLGGVKQSGMGRELGRAALELYTELKSVCIVY